MQQGNPSGCQVPSPCPVFLLLGNDKTILALFVIPYGANVIPHLLLHLHISLEGLVGSYIHKTRKDVVGFRCCPNSRLGVLLLCCEPGHFLEQAEGKKTSDLFCREGTKCLCKSSLHILPECTGGRTEVTAGSWETQSSGTAFWE